MELVQIGKPNSNQTILSMIQSLAQQEHEMILAAKRKAESAVSDRGTRRGDHGKLNRKARSASRG